VRQSHQRLGRLASGDPKLVLRANHGQAELSFRPVTDYGSARGDLDPVVCLGGVVAEQILHALHAQMLGAAARSLIQSARQSLLACS
jgi:hypothetical protein